MKAEFKFIPAYYAGGTAYVVYGEKVAVLSETPSELEISEALSRLKGETAEESKEEVKATTSKRKTKKKQPKPEKTEESDEITFESLFGASDSTEKEPEKEPDKDEDTTEKAESESATAESTETVTEAIPFKDFAEAEERKASYEAETIETQQDAASYVLTEGKHKGQTVAAVAATDPGYVSWLSKSTTVSANAKKAAIIMIRSALSA